MLGAVTVKSGAWIGAAGGGIGTLTTPVGVTFQAGSIYTMGSPRLRRHQRFSQRRRCDRVPGTTSSAGFGANVSIDIMFPRLRWCVLSGTAATEGGTFTIGGDKWKITYWVRGHDIVLTANRPINIWTGAGANNLWSTAQNWSLGVPQAGQALQFPASALQKSNINNLPANFQVGEIDLLGSGYNLTGNAILLDAGIQNSAPAANTVALAVTVNRTSVWTTSGSATLTDSGSVNVNGRTLYIVDSLGASGTTLSGVIAGAGAIFKIGAGTLTYAGAHRIRFRRHHR